MNSGKGKVSGIPAVRKVMYWLYKKLFLKTDNCCFCIRLKNLRNVSANSLDSAHDLFILYNLLKTFF